jgi:hypothetical protein
MKGYHSEFFVIQSEAKNLGRRISLLDSSSTRISLGQSRNNNTL